MSPIDTLLLTHSKSFQSSSRVLDPVANPTLFQSTLAIIIKVRIFDTPSSRHSLLLIKDVIDSDTKEIVNEYALFVPNFLLGAYECSQICFEVPTNSPT